MTRAEKIRQALLRLMEIVLVWPLAAFIIGGIVLAFVVIAYLLVTVLFPRATAPLSARNTVAPTEEAIAALFDDECIKQRNIGWLRAQMRQKHSDCDNFLNSPDQVDACLSDEASDYSWPVPTTNQGQVIVRNLLPADYWRDTVPDSGGFESCAIIMDEALGRTMMPIVQRNTASGGPWPYTFLMSGGDGAWELRYQPPGGLWSQLPVNSR